LPQANISGSVRMNRTRPDAHQEERTACLSRKFYIQMDMLTQGEYDLFNDPRSEELAWHVSPGRTSNVSY
jgi:hypothetical protein